MRLQTSFLVAIFSASLNAAPLLPSSQDAADLVVVDLVVVGVSPGVSPGVPSIVPSARLAIDPDLVPDFGVIRGLNANAVQIGSCDGFTGTESVLIPCFCPPDRNAFLQKLSDAVIAGNVLGEPIQFSNDPSDLSIETQRARATACVILLQSFNGTKGVGCPAASAPNFLLQQETGVLSDRVFLGA